MYFQSQLFFSRASGTPKSIQNWSSTFKKVCLVQCDQIGRFLNDLGNKFSLKRSPNIWRHLRQFWKMGLFNLNFSGFFLGNYWKNLATSDFHIWSHWSLYWSKLGRKSSKRNGDLVGWRPVWPDWAYFWKVLATNFLPNVAQIMDYRAFRFATRGPCIKGK